MFKFFNLHCILLLFLFSPEVKAQFVSIPDTNFVNWLNANGYSGCMNGNMMDTTCTAVVNANNIDIKYNMISNLSGIQYFDNLYNLDCRNNQLLFIPELPISLNYLFCDNNQITTITSLPNSITFLSCQYNQLASLPILPTSLKWLYCQHNLIISLPTLPTNLIHLYCSYNLLAVIPILPDSLTSLSIHHNPNLTCLPIMHNLIDFVWSSTNISCIPNSFSALMANPSLANIPICAIPPQSGVIAGPVNVCQGVSVTYSINAVPNSTSYIWTLPSGWSGTSTSNSITVTSGNTGGVISVSAKNDCVNLSSAATSLIVTAISSLSPPVSVSVSGGNAKVCPGDNRTYTTPLINGVTYNWTVPPGGNILSGQGTNTINVSFTPNFISNGSISVAIVSGNCSSTTRNIRVNRNIPSTPSLITGSVNGLCNSTGNIYSVVNTPGLTYQWTVPAGATITSGQGTNSIAVSFGSSNLTGSIIVKGVNACGAGNGRSLTVTTKPQNPINISGPSLVCAYQQNAYYTTTFIPNVVSYHWLVPPGATITAGQGGNAMAITYGSNGGFVRVRTLNNCSAGKYINLPVSIVCREGFEHNSDLIFPNPSNSTFTINNLDEGESFNLNIYNLIGEEILQYKNINAPFEFGKDLHPGIYIVNIQKDSGSELFRIIKQ